MFRGCDFLSEEGFGFGDVRFGRTSPFAQIRLSGRGSHHLGSSISLTTAPLLAKTSVSVFVCTCICMRMLAFLAASSAG